MIEIQNLTKIYEGKAEKKAVDNISLTIEKGQIFGFLGPNGAGKSTTIKMMVGLLKQTEGSIRFDGIDTLEDPVGTKKLFSYVPDNPDIYEVMTGLDYLNFLADIRGLGKDERKEKIDEYAKLFSMQDDLGGFIKSYSHGMRQKIVLIGALIHEPEFLILDEPMVGLDPKSSYELKEVMRRRADAGKSVFFSTHVLEVAEKVCDKIAIINHGKIIASGTMDELRSLEHEEGGSLEKIFLELTENA